MAEARVEFVGLQKVPFLSIAKQTFLTTSCKELFCRKVIADCEVARTLWLDAVATAWSRLSPLGKDTLPHHFGDTTVPGVSNTSVKT